ncbi:head-tail connector protein [Paucilactobacillus nenjiangensis]|uniref:Phage gp6-like head-tail connector protein n=1 Tax=Paucilactobacillus nenjiangensis TaxID=1296540 RepID=A0A5P1X108_9LACO|nr:hypothetical protein [Paucilactobacillus nenjiangensis]QER67582.1 hypothetical protein F0161_06735 [Paucilactobacillus nenjiangensis]
MDYLSLSEYKSFGLIDITDDEIKSLLPRASIMLDNITRDFYQKHDLETDKFETRSRRFKLAVAIQIDYMKQTDVTSAESKARRPQSISQTIGRTSVNQSFSSTNMDSSSGLSIDAINALSGTGLLYRGVKYV